MTCSFYLVACFYLRGFVFFLCVGADDRFGLFEVSSLMYEFSYRVVLLLILKYTVKICLDESLTNLWASLRIQKDLTNDHKIIVTRINFKRIK